MGEIMHFPKNPLEFIRMYSFYDKKEVYTNGSELVPVFRVHQMIEHYLNKNENHSNSDEIGAESEFCFSEAIKYMKLGFKLTRKGWNGKGQYVRLVDPYSDRAFLLYEKEECDGTLYPYLALKNAQNGFVPWVPSNADLLMEDWMFYE